MMKRSISCSLCVFVAVIFMIGCTKPEKFSEIPNIAFKEYIQFKSVAGKDSSLDFVFTFQDGDGDLGHSKDEFIKCQVEGVHNSISYVSQNNLFITYEEKVGNVYQPNPLDEPPYWHHLINENCEVIDSIFEADIVKFNSRMQHIQPTGSDKSIEGTLSYHIPQDFMGYLEPKGRFRFYIIDRAGHKSNEITSDELIIVL